jgi:hypothetical protein
MEDKFIDRASEALLEVCNNEDNHVIGIRKMGAIDNLYQGYVNRLMYSGELKDEDYEIFNKTS